MNKSTTNQALPSRPHLQMLALGVSRVSSRETSLLFLIRVFHVCMQSSSRARAYPKNATSASSLQAIISASTMLFARPPLAWAAATTDTSTAAPLSQAQGRAHGQGTKPCHQDGIICYWRITWGAARALDHVPGPGWRPQLQLSRFSTANWARVPVQTPDSTPSQERAPPTALRSASPLRLLEGSWRGDGGARAGVGGPPPLGTLLVMVTPSRSEVLLGTAHSGRGRGSFDLSEAFSAPVYCSGGMQARRLKIRGRGTGMGVEEPVKGAGGALFTAPCAESTRRPGGGSLRQRRMKAW